MFLSKWVFNELDNSVFKFDISAFYGQNIKTLEIKKFKLKWGDELPNFYTHAIELKNFSDLIIQDFSGYPGPKNQKLSTIKLSNGDKILSENYLQHSEHFSRILISQENSRN